MESEQSKEAGTSWPLASHAHVQLVGWGALSGPSPDNLENVQCSAPVHWDVRLTHLPDPRLGLRRELHGLLWYQDAMCYKK